MSVLEWAIVLGIVFVGACAQGSFGFGLGVTAAPVLALVNPDFIPASLLMVALVLTVLVVLRQRAPFEWSSLSWALLGRLPGSLLGTWAVVVLPQRGLIVLFSILVLVGIGLSFAGWRVSPTKPSLVVAGAASGFMGSITSIGGPPMALIYQHETGPKIRASLSNFFLFGAALSVGLLAAAGEIHGDDVRRSLQILPAMVLGFAASRYAARWLDGNNIRRWLLLFSGSTSVLVLVTTFV